MTNWRGPGSIEYQYFDPVTGEAIRPVPDIFDDPLVCVRFNKAWRGHVYGALERLLWPDAWQGSDAERDDAMQQIWELIVAIGKGNCEMAGTDCCCPTTLINHFETNKNIVNNDLATYGGDINNITNNYWDYDGTPKDTDRDLILCLTLQQFFSDLFNLAGQMKSEGSSGVVDFLRQLTIGLGVTGGMVSLAYALGLASGAVWLPYVLEAGAAVAGALSDWLDVDDEEIADTSLASDLACCMYDALKGHNPTFAEWCSELGNCLDPLGSPALAAAMAATACTESLWVEYLKAASNMVPVVENFGQYAPCPCNPCDGFSISNGPTDFLATSFLPSSTGTEDHCGLTIHIFAPGRVALDFGEDVCIDRLQLVFYDQIGVVEHYWALLGEQLFDLGTGGVIGECKTADTAAVTPTNSGRFLVLWATDDNADPDDPEGTPITMAFHRLDNQIWYTHP